MKLFLRALLLFFSSLLVLALLIFFQKVDPAQKDEHATSFVFPDTLRHRPYSIDSLVAIVGTNKGLPPGFEEAALLAYAAYPELKDVQVDMIWTQSGAPMESNFDIITLFGPKRFRRYQILLNDAQNTRFDEILLRNLPFDAQVGILAHELGHIVYYDDLSTLQIAKWAIQYVTDDNFRAVHEKTTDLMPVYHGLGSQIYQYAYYVRYDQCCTELYQQFGEAFIDKFYLTDKEIKEAIKNHPIYGHWLDRGLE